MFEKFKQELAKGYSVQKQAFDASKKSNTPEAKKNNRKVGISAFVFGLIVAGATFVGFLYTGRILIIGVAISSVCIVLGGYMAVTGRAKGLK